MLTLVSGSLDCGGLSRRNFLRAGALRVARGLPATLVRLIENNKPITELV